MSDLRLALGVLIDRCQIALNPHGDLALVGLCEHMHELNQSLQRWQLALARVQLFLVIPIAPEGSENQNAPEVHFLNICLQRRRNGDAHARIQKNIFGRIVRKLGTAGRVD